MTTPPPGPDWYPDPSGKPGLMYWDGRQWHPDAVAETPPPDAEQPPAAPRSRTVLIAALVATLVVLAGIIGVTGYLLLQHKHPSQTPTAQPAPPAAPTAQPAPPSPAVAPPAAAAPGAPLPGLAPFLGHWGGGHSGVIDIRPDGTGTWKYSDMSTCPDAPLAGCGIVGIANFTLTSVVNGTATGSVTSGSNPNNDPPGEPVTIVLGTGLQGKGTVLSVSISKMGGWYFCNETSPHFCAES